MKCLFFWVKNIFILFILAVHCQSLHSATAQKKQWNVIVYIASNNNLHRYVQQNITQMQEIGSNKNVNIVVQLDNHGKQEVTRLFIEKGKSRRLATLTTPPLSVSGTPANLFDFVKSVVRQFPAEKTALILWNHGSGIKDPHIWGRTQPHMRDEAFFYNQKTQLFELNKDVYRGIAFNDVGRTYLTNQDLRTTLLKIKNELLGGKKIDILGTDACHMAMVEVCSQVKEAAHYLIGSQEIEPGAGWNYARALQAFTSKSPDAKEFAIQIVQAYGEKYNASFADLTQSAIDLSLQDALEENVATVTALMLELLKKDRSHLPYLINIRKSPLSTLSFLDNDYIDLPFLYQNLQSSFRSYRSNPQTATLLSALDEKLTEGRELLRRSIIQNTTGPRVNRAGGLSIYFPQHAIMPSYLQTVFARNTGWSLLLGQCMSHNVRNMHEQTNIVR